MYLTKILKEADYEEDQKTDGGIVYKEILVNANLKLERGEGTDLTGRSPLRRQTFSLGCSDIEEEEEEGRGGE
jgi:hypothetical protein